METGLSSLYVMKHESTDSNEEDELEEEEILREINESDLSESSSASRRKRSTSSSVEVRPGIESKTVMFLQNMPFGMARDAAIDKYLMKLAKEGLHCRTNVSRDRLNSSWLESW